ncbi:MAG: DUF975 family protein [Oscillospiraceae bacterium]|jgi:uncharacterized membrane protein|nr:DUF975 family protein [Oscillospiraceae bacterium]
MISREELKSRAKAQIKGNIGILFAIYLVIGLICGTGIGAILAPALLISMIMIFLGLIKDQKPQFGDIFKGCYLFGKALWLFIITEFFIWLWSLLLIIPGIIKSLAYSMAPYILAQNPDLTARGALSESKRMMEGHKGDLFVLYLSFIPWFLLTCVTFGLAAIYVGPYVAATMANFYTEIKDK